MRQATTIVACVFAGMLTMPSAALEIGDSVSLFNPSVTGRSVHVTLNGTPKGNINTGRFTWNLGSENGPEVHTFCTELTQTARDTNFDVVAVENLPNTAPMGTTRARLIAELYSKHYTDAVDFSEGEPEYRDESAAFQIAVWEIAYEGSINDRPRDDGNGDGYTPGELQVLAANDPGGDVQSYDAEAGGSAATKAQTWLDGLTGVYTGDWLNYVLGLTHSLNQDQLIVSIPLPPAAALAGLGLLGLAVGRKRIAKAVAGA